MQPTTQIPAEIQQTVPCYNPARAQRTCTRQLHGQFTTMLILIIIRLYECSHSAFCYVLNFYISYEGFELFTHSICDRSYRNLPVVDTYMCLFLYSLF